MITMTSLLLASAIASPHHMHRHEGLKDKLSMRSARLAKHLGPMKLEQSIHGKRNQQDVRQGLADLYFFEFGERPSLPVLSYTEATRRKLLVSNVTYDISLDVVSNLTKVEGDRSYFSGEVTIKFDYNLALSDGDLTVDFTQGEVQGVSVNGEDTETIYNGNFLTIKENLLKDQNTIVVRYTHSFDQSKDDQEGLHQINDEKDGSNYLYTQFEVYAANKMFPSFDQPDLKATRSLKVKVNSDWSVITTNNETNVENLEGNTKLVYFPMTKQPISTYLMSLHTGPFVSYTDHYYREDGTGLELRVFRRKSRGDIDQKEAKIFLDATKEGLRYFEELLQVRYPFDGSYDQVIIPEYAAGAMENVGAITYNEPAYFNAEDQNGQRSSEPARISEKADRRHNLISTVYHEMAHMWFGNLMTPSWWKDLWLNESFATYYASRAMREQAYEKALADLETGKHGFPSLLLLTTPSRLGASDVILEYTDTDHNKKRHPMMLKTIKDTKAAEGIFDSFTYTRGGKVLRQLSYLVGENNFDQAIAGTLGLDTVQFNNVSGVEFVRAMDAFLGGNFADLEQDWIRTHGFNTLEVKTECAEGKITDYRLIQGLGSSDRLRQHIVRIDHIDLQGGLTTQGKFRYDGPETTLHEMIGKDCPDVVIPNSDAGDYSKTIFKTSKQIYDEGVRKVANMVAQYYFRAGDGFDPLAQAVFKNFIDGTTELTLEETVEKKVEEKTEETKPVEVDASDLVSKVETIDTDKEESDVHIDIVAVD